MMERKSRWLFSALRLYLTIALPVLLTLLNVRLVMSPMFLRFEYTRADFPSDTYGLTREDRLAYAPYAIDYLLNGDDVSYLGDLRFPDGSEMYNERELDHMRDVKVVMQGAFKVGIVGGGLALAAALLLWRRARGELQGGLRDGSVLTLGIIASIILLAVTSWDIFFTQFHGLFFADGTWVFLYSDTLIRLFPEQFWFDAALLIGGLTTLGALIIFAVMWRWRPDF